MIWYWDDIECETREVTDANPLSCSIEEHRDLGIGWEHRHTADFPSGIRIVTEASERGHVALLITRT